MLLDKDYNIKICDFGWITAGINDKRKIFCGTYEYMAPEMIFDQEYDYRIDIWALGILLYELYHNKEPYLGNDLKHMLSLINKGDLQFDDNSVDDDTKDLIRCLLTVSPHKRPTFEKIYESSYLCNYDAEQSFKDIGMFQRSVSVHEYEKKPHSNFTNTKY